MSGGGMSTSGPTPWWQLPEYQGSRSNLESSAPSGYKYDPVTMQYVRTPQSLGTDIAAMTGAMRGATGAPNGTGATGTSTGVYGDTVSVPRGDSGAPPVGAPVAMPDTSKAKAAAFASAKDRVGQLTQGAMAGLRSQLGTSGQLGGPEEAAGAQNIAQAGLDQLSGVVRGQSMFDAESADRLAGLKYQGDITQRGQTLGAETARQALAAQQAAEERRFQQTQMATMLPLLLKGLY